VLRVRVKLRLGTYDVGYSETSVRFGFELELG